ncbi:acyltransferase family protein [Pedobacter jejuensis]|uniref:Acyltransferase n=1 Tax=Pedobacter jejuensis TaxID=1268550 RepID=A0A3N0BR55_9SPHI|nr:acyltransferase family protein [Pedobacter jejuensis]RNL51135.1 acyltransferase [Pedobacter jejuensis]
MEYSKHLHYKWVSGINSIRFILALIVVLSHFENPIAIYFKSSETPIINLTGSFIGILFNGVAAVIAFFIISGFVIHQSSKDSSIKWQSFIIKRYVRILIPLLFVFVLGYRLNHPEKHVVWSLICELVYYTLYPILKQLEVNWKKLLIYSFIVSYVLIALIAWNDVLAFVHQNDYKYHGNYWQGGIFLTWIIGLPCWLLGVLIAENLNTLKNVSTSKIISYRLFVFFLSVVINFLRFHNHLSYILIMNLFALILYKWIKSEIAYYQNHKPFVILEKAGEFSYSLYLFHPVFYVFLSSLIQKNIANYFISLLLTMLGSYIFYLLVEKPSHYFARRL